MGRVQADVQEYNKNGIVASAEVTIDHAIRFVVNIRTHKDENGKEQWFLSYPRRRSGEGWEDAVIPDEDLREEILKCILSEYKDKYLLEPEEPEVVCITRINQKKPLNGRMIVRGMATVRAAGLTIKGITVKETEKGLFINMPQYQTRAGAFRDAVYGCTKETRKKIEQAVLDAYAG